MSDVVFKDWTPDPNCGRGTASIVWSCVVTIVLMTWTVHHPMVNKTSFWHRVARFIRTVTLPEYQVFRAVDMLISSIDLRNKVRQYYEWRDWKLCQAFHVTIGGWELVEEEYPQGRRRRRRAMAYMALAASFFQNTYTYADFSPRVRSTKLYTKVSPAAFVSLIEDSRIARADAPSQDDIRSRTGTDRVAKALTIIQVLWFLADLGWRLCTHRHISPLEVLTFSYVVCGLAVYAALFSCPQAVREASQVEAVPRGSGASSPPPLQKTPGEPPAGVSLPDWASYVVWGLMGVTCAGIYLTAWNFPFGDELRCRLWRASAIVMCPLTFMQRLVERRTTRVENRDLPGSQLIQWEVLSFSLLVPRLIIIAVAFWSLLKMPSDVYDTPSWGSYIGHVGS